MMMLTMMLCAESEGEKMRWEGEEGGIDENEGGVDVQCPAVCESSEERASSSHKPSVERREKRA